MKQKMKRFMAALLGLALITGLMQGKHLTTYAENPFAGLKNSTKVVRFDNKDWYLIEYTSGTVTLLSKECIAASKYDENGSSNAYAGSSVETVVNSYYADNISEEAKKAVSGGRMFLLTTDQATAIEHANDNVLICPKFSGATAYSWWLCSPGDRGNCAAFVDGEYGIVYGSGNYVNKMFGVRPAIKLRLSSAVFDPESNAFIPASQIDRMDISGCTASAVKAQTYSGRPLKPAVRLKDGDTVLLKGTDYTVVYKNNTNVGTARVTIQGIGKYEGTLTKTFKILPKGTALKTLTAGAKSFTVSWTKQAEKMKTSYITGYQIQYSQSKTFATGNQVLTAAKYSSGKRVIKNLTKGKTYYVRIRTYKKINGVNYFSAWSAAKSVKIK